MKARPILFSGDMVRALLDSRKTQTQRVVKPTKDRDFGFQLSPGEIAAEINQQRDFRLCPYGQPGDLLWVREAFAYGLCTESTLAYRATHKPSDLEEGWHDPIKWMPSIHMPRWASRLTLRITNVRVERLQDIREADAIAEGLVSRRHVWRDCEYPLPNVGYLSRDGAEEIHSCPIQAFGDLWQSINGPDSWDANPWVWVIEFEVIKANVDEVLKVTADAE